MASSYDRWGFERPESNGFRGEAPAGSRRLLALPAPGLLRSATAAHEAKRAHDARVRNRRRERQELRWSQYWRRLVEQSGGQPPVWLDPSQKELQGFVRAGIAVAYRGEVWPRLCGVTSRLKEVTAEYAALTSDLRRTPADAAQDGGDGDTGGGPPRQVRTPADATPEDGVLWQISLDVQRTWPGHETLQEAGRASLWRLLVAISRAMPAVGYCQGMNQVAACLLVFVTEAEAFGIFCHLLSRGLPSDWWGPEMDAVPAEGRVLLSVLYRCDRPLHDRLVRVGVDPETARAPA